MDNKPVYQPRELEPRVQDYWEKLGLNEARIEDVKKDIFYCLDMFPYPSGEGLHVGHVEGYTATDIFSRYKRMRGFNVLHPMGWDAFGLPAENTAIKQKTHPRHLVEKNISRFKKQLKRLGFSYDWSKEINTTDPEYYKWTQWIFVKLFEMGLAYEAVVPINWCPSCKTGLANEEVINGKCERCGTEVQKKDLRQWMLRITKYGDRLATDVEGLDWPEGIKELQRNWIGRSEGTIVKFAVKNSSEVVEVFTTRADTLFGATYVVLAPEHPLVEKITAPEQRQKVQEYASASKTKTDLERTALDKEKTGVDTGAKVINPVNGDIIPVWIGDYVLVNYGTGAIMAVPAHDERDYVFANKHRLPIKYVIKPHEASYLVIEKSIPAEKVAELERFGSVTVEERDKEWGRFFRVNMRVEQENDFQKFLEENLLEKSDDGGAWYADSSGTTDYVVFPGVHFDLDAPSGIEKFKEHGRKIGIPEEQLDIKLRAFTGDGVLEESGKFTLMHSAEARGRITQWLEDEGKGRKTIQYKLRDWVFSRQRYWGEPIPIVHCDECGVVAVPEEQLPVLLPEVENYEPTGTGESPLAGITEWVNTTCPECGAAAKRETNTMPQWAGSCWYFLRYLDPEDNENAWEWRHAERWMPVNMYVGGAEHAVLHLLYARFWMKALFDGGFLPFEEPFASLRNQGTILGPDGQKMSKSKGNVVNPDDIVEKYGADTLRLYEMFLGPFEANKPWDEKAINGVSRFLYKVWAAHFGKVTNGQVKETKKLTHRLVKKVTEDIESLKFNTAISSMMEYVNAVTSEGVDLDSWKIFLRILSPFAPHIAEELWQNLAAHPYAENSVTGEEWPSFDPSFLEDNKVTIVVQINGKVRDTFEAQNGEDEETLKKKAAGSEKVSHWLEGKNLKRTIVVRDKLVNFVIGE